LIVADRDDTARTCLLVRNEPQTPSIPFTDYQLYPLSRAKAEQLTDTLRVAGTTLATTIIEGLLEYNDAYKRTRVRGRYYTPSPWPLSPSQASGLHAALYYLGQYVETLPPEPGG
jgi:hypothetical protein